MLYGDGEDDIISQYVNFTRVYQQQSELHGRTRKAVWETIHICKDRGVLKEYLSGREKEVVSIMMAFSIRKKQWNSLDTRKGRKVVKKGVFFRQRRRHTIC